MALAERCVNRNRPKILANRDVFCLAGIAGMPSLCDSIAICASHTTDCIRDYQLPLLRSFEPCATESLES